MPNNQQNFPLQSLCQINTTNSNFQINNLLIFFLIFLEKLAELIFFIYLKRKIKQNLIKREVQINKEFSCSGKIITRKIPKRKNRFGNSKIDEENEEDITIYDKCQHLSGWKPRRSDLTPPPPLPVINKNGREIK
uniref:Uncharacterized protein n=1 Tax=Meloidogyne enterolobii TaxID=390850 RepID=A0A6V7XAV6_MELEN|nr:unnamed protein product [Meloidogyne enterolobii]